MINNGKKDEAQLIFDLKKELGFNEQYFENKLNYLFGYTNEIDKAISEKNILEFHLAHKTNPEFSFEPKENTSSLDDHSCEVDAVTEITNDQNKNNFIFSTLRRGYKIKTTENQVIYIKKALVKVYEFQKKEDNLTNTET